MTIDFTLQKYVRFCRIIKESSLPILTFSEFIEKGQPQFPLIVLRHDIDRSFQKAVQIAEVEASYGLRSTYYIRMTKQVYRPSMIRKLVRRGHEVGYHYETLTRAKGDCFLSISLFEEELEMLRRIVNIKTISMHGSPLSKWNNMDIWKFYDYKKYDVDEILLSIAYFNIHYFTDTGRSWERSYNIRDRVGSISPQNSICSTEDLIEYLQFKIEGPVFINVHPNRWTSGFFNLCISIFSDWGINQIKRMISKINGTWNS